MTLTGIVILNWNNAAATMDCLRSIAVLSSSAFVALVVDNGSTDGSASEIFRWLGAGWPRGQTSAEDDGVGDRHSLQPGDALLIRLPQNTGYGRGNNAGIARALEAGCDWVWILNNDTRVAPQALRALETARELRPDLDMVGTTIIQGSPGSEIALRGGAQYRWLLSNSRNVVQGDLADPDYISGASLCLSARSLRRVGTFDPAFFLYSEDVDLGLRYHRAGLAIGVVEEAIVRHEGGATTGSATEFSRRSATSVFHSCRSAVILARKHRAALTGATVAVRLAYATALLAAGNAHLWKAALKGTIAGARAPL